MKADHQRRSKRAKPYRRRISFGEFEAAHIYQWLTSFWGDEPRFGGCALCQQLGARLARFIGASEVRRIRRVTTQDLAKARRHLAARRRSKRSARRRRVPDPTLARDLQQIVDRAAARTIVDSRPADDVLGYDEFGLPT
jgi:hypothetical protein